ncbi:MAG: hypothetical protein JW809_17210 [Pirellulales bacterium]|nr:hypothetical protein [Pirellulales bacterium]
MRRNWARRFALAAVVLCAGWGLAADPPAKEGPAGGQVFLPARDGAAGVAARIAAQARYLGALGDRVEAPGKETGAVDADSARAVKWASTYFDRREVDRARRIGNWPGETPSEAQRRDALDRRVRDYFRDSLKGDLTAELNWLLHQLAGMTLPYQYLADPVPAALGQLDAPLEPHEIHHIQLTDGGREKGRLLVFRADTAEVLETPWPRALRKAEFAPLRAEFEQVRDKVLAARTDGRRDPAAEARLMAVCDELCQRFNRAYPREVRIQSSATYGEYLAGKRFLQALAAGVVRVLTTEDQWVFSGEYRFDGQSVLELINHMCRHGLEFAPCAPGGEGTYRVLFAKMRQIYLRLAADDPQRELERL